MEKASRIDHVRNVVFIAYTQGEEDYTTYDKKKERLTGLVIPCVGNAF
jgi:hypothetical protein